MIECGGECCGLCRAGFPCGTLALPPWRLDAPGLRGRVPARVVLPDIEFARGPVRARMRGMDRAGRTCQNLT